MTTPADELPATGSTALPVIRLGKVVVPIDFSDPCKKALKYAGAFAARFDATLVLLHVLELNVVLTDMSPSGVALVEGESQERATEQLTAWAKRQIDLPKDTQLLVRSGRPYWEIVELARGLPADLIIIASHGHSSLAHVLLGSTVERVVRHAPCPVLVIRPQERDFI